MNIVYKTTYILDIQINISGSIHQCIA